MVQQGAGMSLLLDANSMRLCQCSPERQEGLQVCGLALGEASCQDDDNYNDLGACGGKASVLTGKRRQHTSCQNVPLPTHPPTHPPQCTVSHRCITKLPAAHIGCPGFWTQTLMSCWTHCLQAEPPQMPKPVGTLNPTPHPTPSTLTSQQQVEHAASCCGEDQDDCAGNHQPSSHEVDLVGLVRERKEVDRLANEGGKVCRQG